MKKPNKSITCHICGATETRNPGTGIWDILFIYYGGKDDCRKPLCSDCHQIEAKAGAVRCPVWYNHHIGSTCGTCGAKN